MKPQIDKNVYFERRYNNQERFISYFNQIDLILNENPKKVLEIGIGNKIVSNYLKSLNIEVKTFDFDEDLNPDILGDINNIDKLVNEKFDLICCFEVLEHIPFERFESILKKLVNLSNKLIISLPHTSYKISLGFKLPFIKRKDFLISIPSLENNIFDGEHYWELGKKGTRLNTIRESIKKYYLIKQEIRNPLNPNHRFFVLYNK